jgi:hypothetical protein
MRTGTNVDEMVVVDVTAGQAAPSPGEDMVREDEFRCARCGMIVLRSRMCDAWLCLCPDCARDVSLLGSTV